MVEVKCKRCGKIFKVYNYRKDEAKFCSMKCSGKFKKGKSSWNKGIPCREKTKGKLSKSNKGKHNSPNTEFKKGYIPWHKGKKCPTISKGKLGKKRPDMINNKFSVGRKSWNKGMPCRKETKEKISKAKKGKVSPRKGKRYLAISGKNNYNWKGGITKLVEKIRKDLMYKEWRLNVFERDNFTCQMPMCDGNEKDLNAHHIIEFIIIVKSNNINTIKEAIACKKLWDTTNGITLCKICHNKIRTHEQEYEPLFKEIIALK